MKRGDKEKQGEPPRLPKRQPPLLRKEGSFSRGHRVTASPRRAISLGGVLVLLLVIVLIGAAMLGAERLPLFDLNEQQRSILYDIRLPRILLGACVGASLAIAGAGLQSLLRNPLAEPYLLGVSNGAALGTMLAFVFFQSLEITRPLLAFAGAGLATFAVYRMAKIPAWSARRRRRRRRAGNMSCRKDRQACRHANDCQR